MGHRSAHHPVVVPAEVQEVVQEAGPAALPLEVLEAVVVVVVDDN